MANPVQFYLIVDNNNNIIDFRNKNWNPSDVSPYRVLHWTGAVFVEWKVNEIY